jgi:hypothetical protein
LPIAWRPTSGRSWSPTSSRSAALRPQEPAKERKKPSRASSGPRRAQGRLVRQAVTPGWFLVVLLVVEGLLWLSNRLGWPVWHKGYAVLTAVASVGVAMLLMLLWCIAALIFRLRFQFSLCSLLGLVVVIAISCSWLSWEMRRSKIQGATEGAAEDAIIKGGGWVSYEHFPGSPSSVGSGYFLSVPASAGQHQLSVQQNCARSASSAAASCCVSMACAWVSGGP